MKRTYSSTLVLAASLLTAPIATASPVQLVATKTSQPPVVDGNQSDSSWSKATAISVKDGASDVQISLKALYDEEHIYLLASYPDADESRVHKALEWDSTLELYKINHEREDSLVLKWDTDNSGADLTLSSDLNYRADTWFWKADRTDPVGFADDKIQVYSRHPLPNSKPLKSANGSLFYLIRKGDQGNPAYQTALRASYEGDKVHGYSHHAPTGSRADIQAKGHWQDGQWTIEFKRKLVTGNSDDIQLSTNSSAILAVSRYEVAGRTPNPSISQPLHGAGEVGPLIKLKFGP